VCKDFLLVELEARENAAVQNAAKDKHVKEQYAKDAAKQLEQEVQCAAYVTSLCMIQS